MWWVILIAAMGSGTCAMIAIAMLRSGKSGLPPETTMFASALIGAVIGYVVACVGLLFWYF